MKTMLIIAEKDTLAQAIAKAFAKHSKKKFYYEAEDSELGKAVITYTYGHILEVDVKKSLEKAGFPDVFPAFPERFVYKVKSGRKELLMTIKKLLSGKVDEIISAGDPDREGELLIREVFQYFKVPKEKIKRMWFNSTTPKELKRAVKEAKPLKEFDRIYFAGVSRQFADFYLGINASNALISKTGNRNMSLGRVQTPILRLIVERDLEIENFKPQQYFVIKIEAEKQGFKPFWATFYKHVNEKNTTQEEEKEKKLSKERAQIIINDLIREKTITVKSVKKELKKQKPPKLYTLSTLSIDAGRAFKYRADKVLKIVQAMYERGIVSYPRTASPYLSTNDRELVIESLSALGRKDLTANIPNWIFNDKSVAEAGHHAIIPLAPLEKSASDDEKRIYDLILRRFLAQFYPLHEFEQTTVLLQCSDYLFKVTGKVEKTAGWRELYRKVNVEEKEKDDKNEEQQIIPPLSDGEILAKKDQKMIEKWTKPPKRFTSASLIAAMKKLGLGTEATRSSYQPLLEKRGYIETNKKGEITSTELGRQLILSGIRELTFTDPEFTAKWEQYLDAIERGKVNHVVGKEKFLRKAKELVEKTVQEINSLPLEAVKRKPSTKMLNFALFIAKNTGVPFDESRKDDYDYVRSFIDENQDKIKPEKPSEKQIELARKLSETLEEEIPQEAFENKLAMKKWLDAALKKAGWNKKRKKGRKRKAFSKKR